MEKAYNGHIKKYFSCDSKYIIYISMCKTYDNFNLGQIQYFTAKNLKT